MVDEVAKIPLFQKFLAREIELTDEPGILKGIEEAALELFYQARQKRRATTKD